MHHGRGDLAQQRHRLVGDAGDEALRLLEDLAELEQDDAEHDDGDGEEHRHDETCDLTAGEHLGTLLLLGEELLAGGWGGLAPRPEAGRGVLGHDAAVTAQHLAQPREPLSGHALDPQVAGRVVLPPHDGVRRVLLRHDPPREVVRVAVARLPARAVAAVPSCFAPG